MAISYANRVKKAVNYFFVRLGTSITYKRIKSKGEWSPTGQTVVWWEQPTITAIAYEITTRDIEDSGGRLKLGDLGFIILDSAFTNMTGKSYIQFSNCKAAFTTGETITGATSNATATVISYYINTGTIAGSNAAGVLYITPVSGVFVSGENINGSVGGLSMAKTASLAIAAGTDYKKPTAGDEIVYGSKTYTVEMEGVAAGQSRGAIVFEDITNSTYTVFGRIKNA